MKVAWQIERSLVVKEEAETDPRYGCPPDKRPIRELLRLGIINLNKPPGPTSHQILNWIKEEMGVRRAGHGGTLDPAVTGVLPIALEDATRGLQALLHSGKEYVCLMRLHEGVGKDRLKRAFEEFTGQIYQLPPVRSAVKRRLRKRAIYYIDLLESRERWVLFKVGCEAGTYIRKLCHDIGEAIGCGAHMLELRRTRVGPFVEENSVSLYDLFAAHADYVEKGDETALRRIVKPFEVCFELLPKIYIRDSAVDAICHGAKLAAPGTVKLDTGIERGEMVAVLTLKGEAVALMKALRTTGEILEAERGFVAEPVRVLMDPSTYPRTW